MHVCNLGMWEKCLRYNTNTETKREKCNNFALGYERKTHLSKILLKYN